MTTIEDKTWPRPLTNFWVYKRY